jgi:phosphoglycolate phosphatase
MDGAPAEPIRRVRGVVFDLDGTLVDGYEGIASGVNAARRAFGLPPLAKDEVRGRVGLGLTHLMGDVLGPERAAAGAEIFAETYDRVCETETHAVLGLVETLAALRSRGVRIGLASNKPVHFSIRILEHLGVISLFDAIEGPETAGAIKPDPRMIRACLRAMNVEGQDAIYVGDMLIDAEAGDRAGVDVVLVAGGSCSADELRATGRPVLASLNELLAWIHEAPTRLR